MQRERHYENDRTRTTGDGPPAGDDLNQQRREFDALTQVSDTAFDAITSVHSQNYLEQNQQTGGQ